MKLSVVAATLLITAAPAFAVEHKAPTIYSWIALYNTCFYGTPETNNDGSRTQICREAQAMEKNLRKKDQKLLPAIHGFAVSNEKCMYGEQYIKVRAAEEADIAGACNAVAAMRKKLNTIGFCTFGPGNIGKFSKGRKHCRAIPYVVDN